MSRNILLSIALGLVLITAIGGYFVFYRSGPVSPAPEAPNQPASLPGGTDRAVSNGGLGLPLATDIEGNRFTLKKVGNLSQLTNKEVGGATYDLSNTGSSTKVLFTEKGTGHIYSVDIKVRESSRLTNTTILKINQVWWGQSGSNSIAIINHTDKDGVTRWLNATIKTASTSEGELMWSNLDQSITSLDISPDGKSIAYLKKNEQGVSGEVLNLTTNSKTNIFNSIFRDWNISWDSQSKITANAKPAAGVIGLAKHLIPTTNQPKTIIENIAGLTTLTSPDGQKVLVGTSNTSSNMDLSIYDLTTKDSTFINLSTLPEKCVWSTDNSTLYCGAPDPLPRGLYPDHWYSGEISFSDAIWKINTESGSTTKLFDSKTSNLNTSVDVFQPFLSTDKQYLIFTNKQDLTLWALDLDLSQ